MPGSPLAPPAGLVRRSAGQSLILRSDMLILADIAVSQQAG
jgi:hypothetical protein